MEYIFGVLCGLLYLIGIPFGWSYETTSIYICIYLWPILCCISTIPIFYISIKLLPKVKGFIFSIISIIYSWYYISFTLLFIDRYNINNPNSFTNCMLDLKVLAEYLGVTYATINILIYIVAFISIIGFNFGIYKLINKIKQNEMLH